MLVAAALALPAGTIGRKFGIGQMGIVFSSLLALAIQIVRINISRIVISRLYGVTNRRGHSRPDGPTIPDSHESAASVRTAAETSE